MVGLGSHKDRWCIGYAHIHTHTHTHKHKHTKTYQTTATIVIIVAFHKEFPLRRRLCTSDIYPLSSLPTHMVQPSSIPLSSTIKGALLGTLFKL